MENQIGTYDQAPLDKDPGTTVLIVDNESKTRDAHRIAVRSVEWGERINILEAGSISSALGILSRQRVHVILLDKDLGRDSNGVEQNGIKKIPEFMNLQPHIQILVVTGSDADQDKIEAMQLGAMGFVTKGSPEVLVAQIRRAVEYASKQFQQMVSSRVGDDYAVEPTELAGVSSSWKRSLMLAEAFARSDAGVLITGESGTGKSRLARLIHEYRGKFLREELKTFIPVNIGALNPNLVEAELFGSEKGAYTDSKEAKVGYFHLANHGTLFLDEIGNIPPAVQAKLLTAIEEKTYCRVGGTQQFQSHCKIICATNADLRDLVKKGLFREDLYMRIAVLEIHLDPLKERREDVPEIIKAMLPKLFDEARVERVPFNKLPKDLIQYLQDTPIEGNVRGLRAIFQKLIPMCSMRSSTLDLEMLKQWRSLLEGANLVKSESLAGAGPLTLDELRSREFALIGDGFPGMHEAVDIFIGKLLDEAKRKYKKNNAIGRALKISKSSASAYLAKMQKSVGRTKRAPVS